MDKLVALSFLIVVSGCSQRLDHRDSFQITTVEESDTLLDKSHKEIAFPAFIRIASNNFLLYDAQRQRIVQFNYEGDQLVSFGSEGRGPGEFLSLTNVWIMKDHYLLYDYNGGKMVKYDFKGSFMNEFLVNNGELTATIEVLSQKIFIYPANGEKASLLKMWNRIDDTIDYIGDEVAGENETSTEVIQDIISKGGIPNYMKNNIFFGKNESGIFSFQLANAILQKFNIQGKLLWERDLKVPQVDGVFDDFLKEFREQDRYIPLLTYAQDMHVYEHGAAILLNTSEDVPTTVIWVTNDGNNVQVIEYPTIKKPTSSPILLRFRVANEQNKVFFVNPLEGCIITSTWPIESTSHSSNK